MKNEGYEDEFDADPVIIPNVSDSIEGLWINCFTEELFRSTFQETSLIVLSTRPQILRHYIFIKSRGNHQRSRIKQAKLKLQAKSNLSLEQSFLAKKNKIFTGFSLEHSSLPKKNKIFTSIMSAFRVTISSLIKHKHFLHTLLKMAARENKIFLEKLFKISTSQNYRRMPM